MVRLPLRRNRIRTELVDVFLSLAPRRTTAFGSISQNLNKRFSKGKNNIMLSIIIKAGKPDPTEFLTVRDIKDNLDTFREIIGCEHFEMPFRKIGNEPFVIICDDIGALRDNPIPSVLPPDIARANWETVFGNCIIVRNNGPELESVKLTDIGLITSRIIQLKESFAIITD